ncbi:MAG: hypothetical protein AVDCRST_MAG56-4602 [uncultured Cytophagales bacterium]|uniref:Uncharacterized protein n=1 Tax=uncultured Cytophagales bacterium TaxID=158755 RepID=A0A6J4JX71_9SPHI|nr:MAG: hypothetical protein AVDCRST_MAG56-4602 [uncultured Cytophagales bacterium]
MRKAAFPRPERQKISGTGKNIFNPADIELSPAGRFFVMELEN